MTNNNSDNSTTTSLKIPLSGIKGFSAPYGISTTSFVPSSCFKSLKLLSFPISAKSSQAPSSPIESSSSSSMINEYHLSSFIPDMKFELPNVQIITKQINQLFAEKFDSLLVQNTQILLFGATLGAAISAGVFLGLFSVGFLFNTSLSTSSTNVNSIPTDVVTGNNSTSFSERYRIFRQKLWERWFGKEVKTNESTQDQTRSDHCNHNEDNKENMIGKNNEVPNSKSNGIVFIQGNPCIENINDKSDHEGYIDYEDILLEKQYRSCLNSITSSLQSKGLRWNDVRQCNIKLVATTKNKNIENATLFRNMLKEYHYPFDHNNDGSMILSIVFVMALEDIDSLIQIDAMAMAI